MHVPPPSYSENLDIDEVALRPTLRRVKQKNTEERFQNQVRAMVRKRAQTLRKEKGQNRSLQNIGARNGFTPLPNHFSQRVVVQARVVRHTRNVASQLQKHLHYIQRDGTGLDERSGQLYGAELAPLVPHEVVQETAHRFTESCAGDRHSFRLIVSPENAHELDLTLYTKHLMREMEKDLGTKLQWVAVNHYNTDNPHTHILLRGKDDHGKDLVIDPQYISQGMRYQAMHLATLELGPRTVLDIQRTMVAEVNKERFTQWDRALLALCNASNNNDTENPHYRNIDLRYTVDSPGAIFRKKQLLGRVRQLELLGLARRKDQSGFLWELSHRLEQELKALGMRGDIIKTIHHSLHGEPQQYRIFNGAANDVGSGANNATGTCTSSITGRIADKGLVNELYDREYIVVEALDGYAYYVALGSATAAAGIKKGDTVLVQVADITHHYPGQDTNLHQAQPKPSITVLSKEPLDQAITSQTSIWLDAYIVSGNAHATVGQSGYGRETHQAIIQRQAVLLERGIATRSGDKITLSLEALNRLKGKDREGRR